MDDPETKVRMSQFENFVNELKNTRIWFHGASLYETLIRDTSCIRDIILSASSKKSNSMRAEIVKIKKGKSKKFISLENYATKRKVLNALEAEEEEMQIQIEEHNTKIEMIINDLKMMDLPEKRRMKPSKCGVDLIAVEFLKEFTRIINPLPIYAKRSAIIEIVDNNQFVVLKGETGSGKSTQLAQYLMERFSGTANSKVICTQPRKVAAISLARRIAQEQFQKVGEQIGYWVGMNKCLNKNTRLILMTDRVLLNYCMENPQLDGVSCVIIDEAHERSLNIDLLLGMVKHAAKGNKDLKVVVTSATISTKQFSDYFYGCPFIEIPGRMYPVDVMYDETEGGQDYVKKAVAKALHVHCNEGPGDILVFLTTPIEVDNAVEAFAKASPDTRSYIVLPLHGKLQPEQQMRVFKACQQDKRKIVFSTNVAETSVTIPGIKFVIDSGRVKEKFYDAKKGLSYLAVKMVSKSSAIQRMGRAGRTGPGVCIRLYSKSDYDSLEEATLPEIKKMHLGSAVLSLMALGIDDVMGFDFIERPDEASLSSAISVLKMLGAIDEVCKLTTKGKNLAKLPLEPRAGKVVLDGVQAGCQENAVNLAAAMVSSSSVYFRPGEDEKKKLSDEAKVKFCNKEGDLLSIVDIYNGWKNQHDKKAKNKWCSSNYINAKTMRSMSELISEINFALKDIRIQKSDMAPKSHEEKQAFLKDLLISVYYDNVAFFTGHSRIGYWSPKFAERFFIHPSSVFGALAMQPEFVVFQDVLKTSANFITGVTPANKLSLENLCPNKRYSIDFNQFEAHKVIEMVLFPVGPSVVRALIGKRWETKKALEALITDEGKEPGLLEMSVDERKVAIFTSEKRREMAEKLMKERLHEQNQLIERETKTEDLGPERTGHRVVIAAGGEIQEILQPSESCKLEVEVKNRFANDVIKAEILKEISQEISAKLASIKGVKHIKEETRNTPNIIKWGQISFTKLEALEDAKKGLNFVAKGYEIEAKQSTYRGDSSDQSRVRITVTWSRRKSRGFGFVKLRSRDNASIIAQSIKEVYACNFDKKDIMQIHVKNVDPALENEAFRKSIEMYVGHNYADDIVDVYIVYEKASNANLEIETQGYERQIRERLHGIPCESLFMFPIKKEQSIYCKANIDFKRFEHAQEVVGYLNGPNVIGTQMCHSVIVLKQQLFCTAIIFEAIATEIDEIMTLTKKSTNKITVQDAKEKGAKIITISGEDSSTYKVIFCRLQDLINGEMIENFDVSQVSYNAMLRQVQSLERRVGQVKIEYDKRHRKFRVYGNPKRRKLLKDGLGKIRADIRANKEIKISLNGKGKKPGLMKELMRRYGPRLQKMMPSSNFGIIELNIRHQLVHVTAPAEVTDSVLSHVNKCNEELLDANATAHDQSEADDNNCPLCLCEPDASIYILQSCGHAYCSECIDQYFESCMNDKNFPIKCCVQSCERNLVIRDLDLLTHSKEQRFRFMGAAVGCFVTKNSKSYKYCPTPDCSMVYRISDEQNAKAFYCSLCTKATCTGCHQNAHSGFQSCIAWKTYKDDEHVFDWAKQVDARQCPKCCTMIEKNKGCMHVACKCGAHICWKCMEVFQSGEKCYSHQTFCKGKLPQQINRIIPQARTMSETMNINATVQLDATRRTSQNSGNHGAVVQRDAPHQDTARRAVQYDGNYGATHRDAARRTFQYDDNFSATMQQGSARRAVQYDCNYGATHRDAARRTFQYDDNFSATMQQGSARRAVQHDGNYGATHRDAARRTFQYDDNFSATMQQGSARRAVQYDGNYGATHRDAARRTFQYDDNFSATMQQGSARRAVQYDGNYGATHRDAARRTFQYDDNFSATMQQGSARRAVQYDCNYGATHRDAARPTFQHDDNFSATMQQGSARRAVQYDGNYGATHRDAARRTVEYDDDDDIEDDEPQPERKCVIL
eukprot:gene8277-9161_t